MLHHEGESLAITGKQQCPCDDPSNAFVRYDDGHGYCFAGGCPHPYWTAERLEPLDSSENKSTPSYSTRTRMSETLSDIISTGTIRSLPKWRISAETCQAWSYSTRLNPQGEAEHLAVYKNADGVPYKIKIRNTGKDGTEKRFYWRPSRSPDGIETPKGGLYGEHLLGSGGKMIIITEGEKDAMTASQLWGNKFAVVSPANGAGGAKKDIAEYLDRLCKFDKVVIAFDMDEPGRKACIEVAKMFPPGKAHIASFPLKDLNEMLCAGKEKELISCLYNARPYRPDGVTTLSALRGEMLSPVISGRAYCFPFLNDWTYGRRDGEVVVLAAGTGIGKSDLMLQIAAHNILPSARGGNYLPTAVFNYEAGPQITAKGIIGKIAGKRFHIPDPDQIYWTPAELESAVDDVSHNCAPLFINDHQGATDWASVKERIRYLAHAEGIKDAFVDPMAALVATEQDERKALDLLMAEAKMLAEELKICFWFNTHVTRPSEGPSHEEGGRVSLKHLRGSNAIGMWASFVFALERNQQGTEEERSLTVFRVLKDRFTGLSTGKTQSLAYNHLTGALEIPTCPLEGKDSSE